MRGVLQIWTWCWCWALRRTLLSEGKVLVLYKSDYVPGLMHAVVADREDLAGIEIEEAVPLGDKRRGWRGVWHGLTGKWVTQRRRFD